MFPTQTCNRPYAIHSGLLEMLMDQHLTGFWPKRRPQRCPASGPRKSSTLPPFGSCGGACIRVHSSPSPSPATSVRVPAPPASSKSDPALQFNPTVVLLHRHSTMTPTTAAPVTAASDESGSWQGGARSRWMWAGGVAADLGRQRAWGWRRGRATGMG
jgi:hypothetical protein